jgi:hypothetical protein
MDESELLQQIKSEFSTQDAPAMHQRLSEARQIAPHVRNWLNRL